VGCEVNSKEDRLVLQEVIGHLMISVEEWQMEFNALKCKVLHLGKQNKKFSYTMEGNAPEGQILEVTKCEKDIGML